MLHVCRCTIFPPDRIDQHIGNTLVLDLTKCQQVRTAATVKHQTNNVGQIGNFVLKRLLVSSVNRSKFQVGRDRRSFDIKQILQIPKRQR